LAIYREQFCNKVIFLVDVAGNIIIIATHVESRAHVLMVSIFLSFKRCWELLKGEIGIMFDQFHALARLPKSFSSYFITLIPKVDSPQRVGNFRPISLLGPLYKLVARF